MKQENKKFYKVLGAIVKRQRLLSGMTVGELSRAAGEQHKTIVHIESGKPFTMHHMIWMDEILAIGIEDIYNYRESNSGEKEESFIISTLI